MRICFAHSAGGGSEGDSALLGEYNGGGVRDGSTSWRGSGGKSTGWKSTG